MDNKIIYAVGGGFVLVLGLMFARAKATSNRSFVNAAEMVSGVNL